MTPVRRPTVWLIVMIALALASPSAVACCRASPWGQDVVVATVKGVSEGPHTKGKPPRVELEITRVLQGDPTADRSRATWNAEPLDPMTAQRAARQKEWEGTPMQSPKIGSRWILAGSLFDPGAGKVFHVDDRVQVPLSDRSLQETVELLRKNSEWMEKQRAQDAGMDRK